jgi:UDP-N-acetylmuramoyl-tripeptide--D-alanyl-D-alanine ligase
MKIPQLYQLFLQHKGISTDSRKIQQGSLFFALQGDHFNGNDFAEKAIFDGAAYAIIDDKSLPANERYIPVKNVLQTLQNLAAYHRNQLSIPVIAITGTNGKTTTKELSYAILSQKFLTVATAGNFNNHIGVPLTLLSINPETEIAIIEMGANHCGEIDFLCKLANPDFGIITNIGKAHLEGFGSYNGVINAKTELYKYLKENNGSIFLNIDNKLLLEHADGIKSIAYGTKKSAKISASKITADPFVRIDISDKKSNILIASQLYGIYNAENIIAAACIGFHFGVEPEMIKKAIEEYKPSNNRSQIIHTKHNRVILDAYNANPSSMELAIAGFARDNTSNKVLILGDMFELGTESEKEHIHILELVQLTGFKDVFLIGPEFTRMNTEVGWHCFNDCELASLWLEHHPLLGSSILVKGSRGMKLETLVPLL